MKLKTRLITAFFFIIFFPPLLFGITGLQIVKYQVNSIQRVYDVNSNTMDVLSNPLQILNRFTRGAYNNITLTAKNAPEKFDDEEYINNLNQDLQQRFSFLILRKDDEIIFRGDPSSSKIENFLPGFGEYTTDIEGGFYIDTHQPLLLKQQDFYFPDGAEGSIFIATDVEYLIPQIRSSAIQLLMAFIIVVVLTACILVYWIYFSILKPLNTLRKATSEITMGNLNYSIEGDPEDEIGQLMIDFEEMRIRIKDLLETQLNNEEMSKELLSNISHDLKTPITAIKGYAEGIMDGVADTPDKKIKYIKTIYSKANKMSVLVDELLLYSKIDANNMTYHFSSINLNEFFKDCIDELSFDLEVKNITISYYNEVDRNTHILVDSEQFKRVIDNIVMNSVKYIENRKGILHIKITNLNDFVKIGIKDNGIGIEKEDIPYIFDRFYRTDHSRNSAKGGTGLGLSIAKKIIEDHDGKIWAESEENNGTTIFIVLKKEENDAKDFNNRR